MEYLVDIHNFDCVDPEIKKTRAKIKACIEYLGRVDKKWFYNFILNIDSLLETHYDPEKHKILSLRYYSKQLYCGEPAWDRTITYEGYCSEASIIEYRRILEYWEDKVREAQKNEIFKTLYKGIE